MHIPPPVPGERVTSRALGRLSRITVLLALSLALLSGAVLAAPRPAVAATPVVNGPTGKLSAADVPSARAEPKRSGKRVEALSERTETSATWVDQDGPLTTELTAGPVRFDHNGSWVTVDTDLTEHRDGTVVAKAHPTSLTLVLEDSAVLTDANPAGLGDTGGEPEEGRREQRFTFSTNSGALILRVEADAPAAKGVLSASASAADTLETTDGSPGPIGEVPDEPIALDADGLPIEEPDPAVQKPAPRVKRAAAQVSGSGTLKWASRNVSTRWEYGRDCTDFVSKALYHGGDMKTRQGGRKHDRTWWQQYHLFGRIKNKSCTWAAAESFRRHMIRYRGAEYVTALSAEPGDLGLFKWKKERGYNHVAIVERKRHGLQLIQHGSSNRTSLAAAILRYRGKSNYIERVVILRPKARF
ncbi:amidase domain-containing protein [Streptomyces sp. NPDC021080]|uniref:amidase domain-containing protein n=1 Tax=Streptomyces sp. NPDC021080 TaxID=3365110 RepID=UPI00378AE267